MFIGVKEKEEEGHTQLVDRCLLTIDTYGLGFCLINSLYQINRNLLSKELYEELEKLFSDMINWDFFKRLDPDSALQRYETILQEHILPHHNMHIDTDHNIVPDTQVETARVEGAGKKAHRKKKSLSKPKSKKLRKPTKTNSSHTVPKSRSKKLRKPTKTNSSHTVPKSTSKKNKATRRQ